MAALAAFLCVAFAQDAVTAVIAGADDEAELDERIRAVDHPLSPEELDLLAAL